ncbi:MAG: AtpZ/AtpI family protein [candidate division Zixibacteria bacterium]|nr:AtpZ/AtpI family protein [candidate division Zixibacteria bacterium]
MPENLKSSFESLRDAGELSVMGLTLAIATAIGYYIGHRVEQAWPVLEPWGGVGGALVGIAAGFTEMARTVKRITRRMERRDENREKPDRPGP